ncbi:MAG: DUF885 domain-containing protein [Chloroflexota bacterium]|nr:DUF885 domain-containing protein [Chloroflexota bacterium]
MPSDATLDYGEGLTAALLGLDALYGAERGKDARAGDGDIERLVVLNLSTTHEPEPFSDYADAQARFTELAAKAADLPEADRRRYYAQTCGSAIAFSRWRTTGLAFPDQIASFLHVPATPAREEDLDALRGELRRMLVELGYAGSLDDQFAAWESRHRVPPDEVEATLNALLSDAWDRTIERLDVPAEKDDGMRVETVSGVPYNAMCDYGQRIIRLNVDPTLTVPGLRHLAVHEGYPGHYVQFRRREVGYSAGVVPADALLSVVNTASSSVFEGIADVGVDLIGWQDEPDDRVGALLARYRSGIGTRAAWRLHAEGWDPARVREELLRDALVGGEGWVDNRMRFLAADDRATLIWSYWHGEPSVSAVWRRVRETPERLPDYVTYVYDRMHSPDSIAMFPG